MSCEVGGGDEIEDIVVDDVPRTMYYGAVKIHDQRVRIIGDGVGSRSRKAPRGEDLRHCVPDCARDKADVELRYGSIIVRRQGNEEI